MRGLWIDGGGVRYSEELEEPAPLADEVRVRVRLAGVCATDLALARGYMGFRGVPGHEFVGEALEGPLAGRRVVGEINAACGACPTCALDQERHCPRRTVLGILGRPGAFAETLRLPTRNLHAVPDGLPDDAAVFVEPLAAAFRITEGIDLAEHERALVIGDGRLGLLCAQVLARASLEVELRGRHPERGTWLPAGIRHMGELEPGTPRERHGLVIEATGDPTVLQRALSHVRPRGTLVLKTTCEAPSALDLAPLVVDEVTLIGSRCGPFSPAIEALEKGEIVVEPLCSLRFPLAEGARAFEHAATPGTLKVVLVP